MAIFLFLAFKNWFVYKLKTYFFVFGRRSRWVGRNATVRRLRWLVFFFQRFVHCHITVASKPVISISRWTRSSVSRRFFRGHIHNQLLIRLFTITFLKRTNESLRKGEIHMKKTSTNLIFFFNSFFQVVLMIGRRSGTKFIIWRKRVALNVQKV